MRSEERHLFGDMRLTRAVNDRPMAYATMDEYASATGMTIRELLDHMKGHVEQGLVRYDTVGGHVFVHVEGEGVPTNLWGSLRRLNSSEEAYRLWRLGRDLEQAGWEVDYAPAPVGGRRSRLGIVLDGRTRPVLLFPDAELLAHQEGPLSTVLRAGESTCVVTCRNRQLERSATAVRRWYMHHERYPDLSVLLLEEPSYAPLKVDTKEGSISPASVSRAGRGPDARGDLEGRAG